MTKIIVKFLLSFSILSCCIFFTMQHAAAADIEIKTVGQDGDVTFEVLDEGGKQVATIATSSNAGKAENIDPGTYTVRLLEVPDNILMSETEYKMVLSETGSVVRRTIYLKEKVSGDYLAFRQGASEPWRYVTLYDNTMGYQGCGPTSIAIALTKMSMLIPKYDGSTLHGYTAGKDGIMQPSEVGKFMIDNNYYVGGQGMSWEFPNFVFYKTLGLEGEIVESGNAKRVLELLKQGWVGVASSKKGFFSRGGHIISIVENDGDKIVIVDPSNGARDGAYTVAQLNNEEKMPKIEAAKGVYANIRRYWMYNPYTEK